MADGRDLLEALDMSRLRIQAVEEQLVISAFSDIDNRILSYYESEKGARGKIEPYEFS